VCAARVSCGVLWPRYGVCGPGHASPVPEAPPPPHPHAPPPPPPPPPRSLCFGIITKKRVQHGWALVLSCLVLSCLVFPPPSLPIRGPWQDELADTRVAQPAILTHSIALARVAQVGTRIPLRIFRQLSMALYWGGGAGQVGVVPLAVTGHRKSCTCVCVCVCVFATWCVSNRAGGAGAGQRRPAAGVCRRAFPWRVLRPGVYRRAAPGRHCSTCGAFCHPPPPPPHHPPTTTTTPSPRLERSVSLLWLVPWSNPHAWLARSWRFAAAV
jgi:hypothetical protein